MNPLSAFRLTSLVLTSLLIAPAARSGIDTSYSDIAPILAEKCIVCHSGQSAAAGLRLDSFEALINGSARGPVVRAGAPADSELIRRIKGISQPRMPMTGPPYLSDSEIAVFERWIQGGLQKGDAVEVSAARQPALQRPAPGEAVTYQHVRRFSLSAASSVIATTARWAARRKATA